MSFQHEQRYYSNPHDLQALPNIVQKAAFLDQQAQIEGKDEEQYDEDGNMEYERDQDENFGNEEQEYDQQKEYGERNLYINSNPHQENRSQEVPSSQASPTKKIQRVENLQNYLTNSYEQRLNSLSTSSKQNALSNYNTAPNSKKNHKNIELVSSELQKVLTPEEILDLAQCLTSKSIGYLSSRNGENYSRSSSATKNKNSFFNRVPSPSKKQTLNSERKERGRSKSNNQELTYAFVRNSQNFGSSQGFDKSRGSVNSQTRSLSANNAQLRLYKYSEIQKERSHLLELFVNKQVKENANSRKISKMSNQILTDQMDKAINNSLQEVDHMMKKAITFEQMGRVLYLLKVFRCLSYDENCRIVSSLVIEKQMDAKRKFQEMFFHEEIWKACSVNLEELDAVSNSIVYCMLRILMDPVQLSISATVNLMREYLAKFNQDLAEYILSDSQFEEQLIKLVEGWKLLSIDKFAYHSIGYLKQRQVEELCRQQEAMMTFHPKIEKTSELFELHSTTNFLQRNPIDEGLLEVYEQRQRVLEEEYGMLQNPYDQRGGTPQGSNYQQTSQFPPPTERYKILYKKQEIIQEKMKKMRQEKQIKEMEACTFHPDLSLNRQINECSVVSHYNGKINIFDRLYRPDYPAQFLSREQQIQEEKSQIEMARCTFKPDANKQRISSINEKIDAKDLVNDFDKSVGRLAAGFQKQQLLKDKLNYISKGEKLHHLKKLPLNPPSQLSRKVFKEPPLKQFQVSISKNKILTISLRRSDDPKKLARNFAKTHQISYTMEKKLEEIMYQYLHESEEVQNQNEQYGISVK